MSGFSSLSPADYAPPTLDEPTDPQAEAAPAAATGAKPDLKKAVTFAAQHFDVDPNVLAGMLMKESALDPDVISCKRRSKAGAIGIAQFMPETANSTL